MATILLQRRVPIFTLGLGLSSLASLSSSYRNPIRLDAPATIRNFQQSTKESSPLRNHGNAIRQLSAGSIAGLLGGLAVSTFSKPLALLIGLLVLGAQALESRGIHVIPYKRIQGLFSNVDVKKAASRNVAFKVSFGVAFLLAGFGSFSADAV